MRTMFDRKIPVVPGEREQAMASGFVPCCRNSLWRNRLCTA